MRRLFLKTLSIADRGWRDGRRRQKIVEATMPPRSERPDFYIALAAGEHAAPAHLKTYFERWLSAG